jgi:hypothetical protein
MKNLRLLLLLAASAFAGAGSVWAIRPVMAQAPTTVTTPSGKRLEQVQVGTGCVVIVSHLISTSPGVVTEHMAATPCR